MTSAKQTEVMPGASQAAAPDVRLPHQAREVIGSRLRRLYDGLVAEPLPDRFQDLLARLAAAEAEGHSDEGVPGGR